MAEDKLEKILNQHNLTEQELQSILKKQYLPDINSQVGNKKNIPFSNKHVKFLALSDLHIGHKNYRPDILDKAIKHAKKESVDFVTMSGDICVKKDTLITTKKGLKNIRNIDVGEEVLTHKNRWQKVTKKFIRKINNEDMIDIFCDSSDIKELSITHNHPVLKSSIKHTKYTSEVEFVKSSELTNKDLIFNIIEDDMFNKIENIELEKQSKFDKIKSSEPPNKIKLDSDFLTIIGLFLGDGTRKLNDRRGTVGFYLSKNGHKDKIAAKILERWCCNNKFGLKKGDHEGCWNYHINYKPLAKFFNNFYDKLNIKTIPIEFLNLPIEQLKYIIYGFILSDGTFGHSVKINNTANDLLKKIKIRLECSGIFTCLNVSRMKTENLKTYYELNFNNSSCNVILELLNKKARNYKAKSKQIMINHLSKKIYDLKKYNYTGHVYNLEVENDNSYIANGTIVHNCEGVSGRDGHVFELEHLGATQQRNAAVEQLNKIPSRIPVYFITASNSHDGWFSSKNNMGYELGPDLAKEVKNLDFCGYDESDLVVAPGCVIRMSHPGDGTAYAISYKMQKYINGLSGGKKPNIILQGHYHKSMYMFYRGIHAFDCGTLEEQTIFMKKKGTPAHLGYWIIDAYYNNKGIERIKNEFVPFYE